MSYIVKITSEKLKANQFKIFYTSVNILTTGLGRGN